MKRHIAPILALLFLLSLGSQALACTGCGGRFPAGVNLRLLRMRMQNDPDRRSYTPPPSQGEAIPMKAPGKESSDKATPADTKKKKQSPNSPSK